MDEYSLKEKEPVADEFGVNIIDISSYCTFSEFMDMLQEDNRQVFYSEGQLYFIKDDILKKTSKGIKDTIYPLSEDVKITTNFMNQKFYETNITINHVISEIKHDEVIPLLHKGYTLIHIDEVNYYSITLSKDEDGISYCIADFDDNKLDPDECYEHYEIISDVLFNSLLNGTWFVMDSKEE